jgi:methyl-accepting chemotaxis protein
MAGTQKAPTPEALEALVAALGTLSASVEQRAKDSAESAAAPPGLGRADAAIEKAAEAIARLLREPDSGNDAAAHLREAVQALSEASLAVNQLAAAIGPHRPDREPEPEPEPEQGP